MEIMMATRAAFALVLIGQSQSLNARLSCLARRYMCGMKWYTTVTSSKNSNTKGRVVDELHEVPDDAIVIFSAHGVSKAVRRETDARGLRVLMRRAHL